MKEIKRIAKIKNKKIKDIAADAGISSCYLSQIIGGNRTPSMSVARKIAASLGVSIGDICQ